MQVHTEDILKSAQSELLRESGPFRVLGVLRPTFARSDVRRKSLIGGSPVSVFGAPDRY
jgi:hypothetical protein